MRYDEPDILETEEEEDWGRRRDNMRHEVTLPGVITDRLGTRISCVIEDVSATGMALNLGSFTPEPGREPLQQGTLATLEFAPDPDHAPADKVTIEVRVMWRVPVAVGVRFTSTPPALRAALKAIAEAAVTGRLEESERRRRELTPAQRHVLQACRKRVHKLLPNLIWVTRTELGNQLRLQAREATPPEARAANDEADLLEQKAMPITRTVEMQILQGFSEASDLEETQELTLTQLRSTLGGASSARLRVQNQADAENGARITAIAHTVEERYKAQVFELNVRLANVIGHPLDAETNTLLPGTICRILWRAITHYASSARAHKTLQRVLLEDVMPLIGELYQAINETLDEEGAGRIFDVRQAAVHRPS